MPRSPVSPARSLPTRGAFAVAAVALVALAALASVSGLSVARSTLIGLPPGPLGTTPNAPAANGSSLVPGTPGPGPSTPVTAGAAGTSGSLLGPKYAGTTAPSFYSLDVQTDCASCIATNGSTDSFLKNTPFHWVRYGANSEQCNVTSDTEWSESGVATHGCAYSVSALKTWCAAQTPHCRSILPLPGENNNSREDANIANYIVNTIGFQPTYWSIGNEPTGWHHYGIPWAKWRTADAQTPTPMAYAWDVHAAIAAVLKVDPAAKFIGIEAACACNSAWFADTVKVNGPNLAAVAVHNYPSAAGKTTVSLDGFYAALTASGNISHTIAFVRSAITGLCTGCASLPIFVNEYNAGPGWSPSNYGGTYANAEFLAASVAQALEANVTQLTIFNLQTYSTKTYGYSMMNGNGIVGPTGLLFSRLLSHLALGQVFRAPVKTSLGNVWSVVTQNSTARTLLVVNANATHALALSLLSSFPLGLLGTVITWGPGHPAPTVAAGKVLGSYVVPSQGMLLLTVHPLHLLIAPALPTAGSAGSAPVVAGSAWLSVGALAVPLAAAGLLLTRRRPADGPAPRAIPA